MKIRLFDTAKVYRLLLLLVCMLAAVSHADSLEKILQTCAACHGEQGYSFRPLWPNLAGQKSTYLADQLKNFRSGKRSSIEMTAVVKNLSDETIQQLANYYANQKLKVTANGNDKKIDVGAHASAYCVSCHGMKGLTANSEWPNLAGQSAAYLQKQLIDFRDGKRFNTNMNLIVSGYSNERIEALAAFYSQLNPE